MKNFKLSTRQILLFGVIIVLLVIIAFKGCSSRQIVDQTLDKHKYDSAQRDKERRENLIIALVLKNDTLQSQIDSLQKVVDRNEKKIENPFKGFDKKDSVIKSYSAKELEAELARRFDKPVTQGDSTATITKKAGRNILLISDSFSVVKEVVLVQGEIISDQKKIISGKDAQLFLKDRIIENKDGIINDLELQKNILERDAKYYKKKWKWSKFKTTVSQIALVAVTVVLITKL